MSEGVKERGTPLLKSSDLHLAGGENTLFKLFRFLLLTSINIHTRLLTHSTLTHNSHNTLFLRQSSRPQSSHRCWACAVGPRDVDGIGLDQTGLNGTLSQT